MGTHKEILSVQSDGGFLGFSEKTSRSSVVKVSLTTAKDILMGTIFVGSRKWQGRDVFPAFPEKPGGAAYAAAPLVAAVSAAVSASIA